MLIKTFCDWYVDHNDLSDGYRRQLYSAVSAFERSNNIVKAKLDDFSAESINATIRNPKISRTTRSNRRRMLCTIATAAAQRNRIERIDPFEICKVKVEKKITRGYSHADALQIVTWVCSENADIADEEWLSRPLLGKATRRHWWSAYLRCCWDTGAPQDMRSVKLSEVSKTGFIVKHRLKTGKLMRLRLSASTLEAVKILRKFSQSESNLLLPAWQFCQNNKPIYKDFKIIATKTVAGSLRYFRSGAGTDVEQRHPNRGHEFLANGRRTFESNYLVHELLAREPLCPRELTRV